MELNKDDKNTDFTIEHLKETAALFKKVQRTCPYSIFDVKP